MYSKENRKQQKQSIQIFRVHLVHLGYITFRSSTQTSHLWITSNGVYGLWGNGIHSTRNLHQAAYISHILITVRKSKQFSSSPSQNYVAYMLKCISVQTFPGLIPPPSDEKHNLKSKHLLLSFLKYCLGFT